MANKNDLDPITQPESPSAAVEPGEDGATNGDNWGGEDLATTTPLDPLTGEDLSQLTQQLPEATEPLINAVQRCHVGAVRHRNEDSSFVFNCATGGQDPLVPFGLYVVADGMGGHRDGHEASKKTSRIIARDVFEQIYLPFLHNAGSAPQSPIRDIMLQAVQNANSALYSPDPQKDSGTTITAALILGRRLYLVHVGDSRAYLSANGELQALTADHSYVQRLIDAGQLTQAEAAVHPQRNVLYRAVGQGGELEVDSYTQSLPRRGKLLLCSDGLWGLVPETVIQSVLESTLPLQSIVDSLVHLALEAGGHDNITAILVDFTF